MTTSRVLEPPRNLDPQLRLRSQVADTGARLAALERELTEAPRYIGAAGQPVWQNSWLHYDSGTTAPNFSSSAYRNAYFYKDRNRVYLGGLIKNGTMGTPAFQLPEGYRPFAGSSGNLFTAVANSAHAVLIAYPNGDIMPYAGSNIWFSLEGISFRV